MIRGIGMCTAYDLVNHCLRVVSESLQLMHEDITMQHLAPTLAVEGSSLIS